MEETLNPGYEFGAYRVDVSRRLLLRDGQIVPLKPKAFEILLALVENRGRVVEKDELMSKVWANTVVEESNLAHHISALRKALDDNHNERRYIVTLPGRGYSFVASVQQPQIETVDLMVAKHTRSQILIEEEIVGDDQRSQIGSPEQSLGKSIGPDSRSRVDSFLRSIKSNKRRAILIIGLLTLTAVSVGFVLSRVTARNVSDRISALAFNNRQQTKLTNTGNASSTIISPDGKYIAYVSRDVAGKSILLRQLGTDSVQEILPPVMVRNLSLLTFSPDGAFIYYNKSDGFGPKETVYKIPSLGGVPPTKLITDLGGGFALSPNGKRVAFCRNSQDESALMIANENGTDEQPLASRKLSDGYWAVSWSPDEKVIVCSAGGTEVSGERAYLVEVRVADGVERELTSYRWLILGSILWLKDGSGFLASGYRNGALGIWHIAYPGGDLQRLTDDSNVIAAVSLTADSKTMVGVTSSLQTTICTAPIGNGVVSPTTHAKQLTRGKSNYQVFGWMPDGKILFTAAADNPLGSCIWVMNPDNAERKPLTSSAEVSSMPSCSPDGSYIVYESNRGGPINIWRMDSNGENPMQLTFGQNEKGPACSPDGKWVVYTSGDDSMLWKVPMAGGKPEQLTESYWRSACFSPNGKLIASSSRDEQPSARFRIGIVPFEGGTPFKMFDPPPGVGFVPVIRWTPDSQALIYACARDDVSNLWLQPLYRNTPTQLTDFKGIEQIYGFNVSRDGQQIVFARGEWTFDIVLIKNFS